AASALPLIVRTRGSSKPRQHDSALGLVFAFLVFVADFAGVARLEEDDLAEAFVGVNFCGQWSGVADFERDEAFPFGLEGRDVDDDSAARVRGLADADGEHIAWNAEVFDGSGERKRV